jgi:hypothetical protein
MRRRPITVTALLLMLGLIAGASAAEKPLRKPPKHQAPFFVGNFNTCDFSQWHTQGPEASFKIVREPKIEGRCAAALTIGPWAAGGLGDAKADGAALWLTNAPYGTFGKTVWQHFSVRFARGFRATEGNWNLFIEWHNDGGWAKFSNISFEYANLCWMIRNRNGAVRLSMRIVGGLSTSPRTIFVDGPRLRTDHWYDLRVRTVWSPDPKKGMVEWWLDGKRLYSHHAATLYTRPDGNVSSVYLIEDHYRRHADTSTTIFFDGTRLGPTRASVRY